MCRRLEQRLLVVRMRRRAVRVDRVVPLVVKEEGARHRQRVWMAVQVEREELRWPLEMEEREVAMVM